MEPDTIPTDNTYLDSNMQSIFNTTPYAMMIVTDGVFVEVNAATISLFGAKDRSELIGKTPSLISPPVQKNGESSDVAAGELIQKAVSGNPQKFEWTQKKLDGTLMDCLVTLAPLEYNGKPSLMTTVLDLTSEKKQQEALKNARENMQTLFDTTPYAMLVAADGVFIEANKAAYTLYGAKKREELIGKSPSLFSPPVQKNGEPSDTASMAHIQQALTGKTEIFDWTHKKMDGSLIDCQVTLAAILYNGKPSLMTTVIDLTEKRKQEQEIIALKQKADWIIDKNPALMFIIDRNLVIKKTNQAWADISGYSTGQLLRMKITDFKVLERTGDSAAEVNNKGKSATGNLILECPKGILNFRYFYIPMIDNEGKFEEILAVYFDETDLKKLEARLDESITEIERVLSLLAGRNLTVQAAVMADDPLISVKQDLNKTVSDLRKVLSDILADSDLLLSSIRDINRSTDDLAHASNDVAHTSQSAADEIANQREQLDTISRDVSDLSASIEEIAASAADVRNITLKVSESGVLAQQQGADATRQMKVVEEISAKAVDQIMDLNNKMQEIGKIVKLISDIASQTNLLALNAAIEAARAGDAGRGFAVVAGEVKNLAGESRQATSNIEEVISGLMKGSNETAESIENAYSTIVAGIKAVDETIGGLDTIVSDVNVASGNVGEISRATDSQAEATNRVNQNIEAVSKMVIETQDRMDSLSANAEESSAATEEIASASSMIVGMVEKLQHKIGEFSV